MNRLTFGIFITISSLVMCKHVLATTVFPPETYLQPLLGTNIYDLPSGNASQLAKSCGLHSEDLKQHWSPTEKQIRTIDKKVSKELHELESSPFTYLKLYFGLTDEAAKTNVYVYVFPISLSEKLSTNFGDDKLVCLKLKSVFEFSIDSLELKRLEIDITRARN